VLDTPQVQAYLPVRGKGPLKILYLTRVLFAVRPGVLHRLSSRRDFYAHKSHQFLRAVQKF
jgi:hypothetical protein